MTETPQIAPDDYTLVYSVDDGPGPDDHQSACLRQLLRHIIKQDTRTLAEIATLAQMSRRQLGRIVAGKKPLRLADLQQLSGVLQIDRARAVVAIEILDDWRSYDDPALHIMMQLIGPVVAKVNAGADFPVEALTGPAENLLSDWLAKTIITNEEQIRNRRNEFVKLPSL